MEASNRIRLSRLYFRGIAGWWRNSAIRRHSLPILLLFTVFSSILGITLAHSSLAGLTSEVVRDVSIALLISSTVGLFYELIAQGRMLEEASGLLLAGLHREGSRIEELMNTIQQNNRAYEAGVINIGRTRRFFHIDIAHHEDSPKKVGVLAIHGGRIWANEDIKTKVLTNPECEVRVILLNPDASAIEARAGEAPGEYDAISMRRQIHAAISILKKWKSKNPVHCELRLTDSNPSFWLVTLDNTMYVSGYPRGKGSQQSEVYKLRASQHSLFHHFKDFFDRTWDQSEEPRAWSEGE